jgi:transcriptional regulator with XRE-family HTH domain
MAEDMALKGWSPMELSRRARVADMTVYRFLSGERQTAAAAKKIAKALGRSPARYLVRAESTAA